MLANQYGLGQRLTPGLSRAGHRVGSRPWFGRITTMPDIEVLLSSFGLLFGNYKNHKVTEDCTDHSCQKV
jgi:hypothetical protein